MIILSAFSGTLASAGGWTPLGERVVGERTVEESIAVASGGSYKQIKLQVKVNPLKIGTVKVTFKDGTSFDTTLDGYVMPPGFTKVIELPEAKSIGKVTFTYKRVGSGAYAPVVRLHGSI